MHTERRLYQYTVALTDILGKLLYKLLLGVEIYRSLPKLDCGSCGSPTCHCLAEDIVQGYASEEDCIVKFKQKILKFAEDVINIEKREQ